jgi:hypothetical protein
LAIEAVNDEPRLCAVYVRPLHLGVNGFAIQKRRENDPAAPVMVWTGDKSQSTLVNPESGKLYAYVWHDGDSKYLPRVFVSPWHAIGLVKRGADLISLLSLPRCTLEVGRTRSMVAAQELAEYALGLRELA